MLRQQNKLRPIIIAKPHLFSKPLGLLQNHFPDLIDRGYHGYCFEFDKGPIGHEIVM